MRICFFGTPDFAAHSLHKLVENGYHDILVITAPDKPAGRGQQLQQSDVKKTALNLGLTVLQPEKLKSQAFLAELQAFQPELGIVIAFRMLPEVVWSMPRLGTFNLHGSLLPQYRGAAPIHHAVIQGEKVSGITTFFLKHEIDTGDILLQEPIEIAHTDNTGILYEKMMKAGAELVLRTLKNIEAGKLEGFPQVLTADIRTAPKLNRAFCEVNDLQDVEMVYNKIRGLSPMPGAWLQADNGKVFKILATAEPVFEEMAICGLQIIEKSLFLCCKNGKMRIQKIQPEGKKVLTEQEFLNGNFLK